MWGGKGWSVLCCFEARATCIVSPPLSLSLSPLSLLTVFSISPLEQSKKRKDAAQAPPEVAMA